jgi:hypothetical protein
MKASELTEKTVGDLLLGETPDVARPPQSDIFYVVYSPEHQNEAEDEGGITEYGEGATPSEADRHWRKTVLPTLDAGLLTQPKTVLCKAAYPRFDNGLLSLSVQEILDNIIENGDFLDGQFPDLNKPSAEWIDKKLGLYLQKLLDLCGWFPDRWSVVEVIGPIGPATVPNHE